MSSGRARVLLPFPPEDIGSVPDDVEIDVYDGQAPPPDAVDDVVFYVLPYTWNFDVTVGLVERMPALQVLQLLTAGYDHVRGRVPESVTLCNAAGVHEASTAELALTLTLASLRGVPTFVHGQDTGEWRFGFYDALADKRVLILGYGRVGSAIGRRLAGFEVDVVRVARTARAHVHGFAAVPGLLPTADVVMLAVPLTDATRGLVDAEFLAAMRSGALLVNVARGPVVDTNAMLSEAGRLRFALDVTDPEPLPAGHPLWRAPGVLISPHVGGSSTAFLPRARRLIREQLRRFAAGEPMGNVVAAAEGD